MERRVVQFTRTSRLPFVARAPSRKLDDAHPKAVSAKHTTGAEADPARRAAGKKTFTGP
jgi:hypothetical protein